MIFDANIRLGRLAASRGPHFNTGADLLETMNHHGVAAALVYSALARESDYRAGNELLLKQIAGHERLVPCWAVVPNRDDPAEFVRQMSDCDVPAVRLFPTSGHYSIRPWCIGELAQALRDGGKTLLIDFEGPHWAADGIDWEGVDLLCGAYPELSIVVCGPSVAAPTNFMPIMARRPNLYLEISQLICPGQIPLLVERGCGNRLLFGSDMPTRHLGGPLNMIDREAITEEQRRAILHDNLARLLCVNPPATTASRERLRGLTNVIDTHVHLGGWNNAMAGSGKAKETIRDMDRCGVSAVVVTSLWSCFGDVAEGNRDVARACAEYPGRIYGYLTLDPKRPSEVTEQIAAYADNPAFVGIKLHGATHNVAITDPLCDPILSYAGEHDLPVLIHGNFIAEPWRTVCAKHPRTRMIVAHVGGCGPDMAGGIELARLCREFDNLYFDIASSRSFYQFLEELIDLAGIDRILYGSDHPLFDFGFELGQVVHSSLSDRDKQRIVSGNAMRLFGLSAISAAEGSGVTSSRRGQVV